MIYVQYVLNGIVLGGFYACLAAGFSLVWGVLNIINLLHGGLIVLGAYVAIYANRLLGIHPFAIVPVAALLVGLLGFAVQAGLINRVITQSVLVTLTLTFGLDLMLNNAMILAFSANFQQVTLLDAMPVLQLGGVFLPLDRAAATLLALVLTGGLWLLLRLTSIGRAIVAVRFDRDAAALMGVDVRQTYALTFALGAGLAAAAGSLLSVLYPISPQSAHAFLGKSFVICVLGGVGSVPGAALGGFALGLIESLGGLVVGPEYATTLAFVLLIVLLVVRPQGLLGTRAFH